jgi:GTPase SAR1 family protein
MKLIRCSFFFVTQFIIMVIDSTDRERLAVTREELYKMLQHEDLSKASLLVYANKQVSDRFNRF